MIIIHSSHSFRAAKKGAVSLTAAAIAVTGIALATHHAPLSSAAIMAGTNTGALASGQSLEPGQQITSQSGVSRLVMQGDGNLVDYVGSTVAWASYTSAAGSYVRMQGDGNLVMYSPSQGVVWQSQTGGHPGISLTLADNGLTSLNGPGFIQYEQYLPAGTYVMPGTQIGNGGARLVMQNDGNFVDYVGATPVWQSGTSGHAGSFASFQGDGNFVVYGTAGPLWTTGTSNQGATSLSLLNNGVFTLNGDGGNIVWARRAYQTPGSFLKLGAANVAYAGQSGADIHPYMNGYRIFLIQRKLGVSISGILQGMYIGNTYGKVTAWQSANGFPANGVIDEEQWTRMGFSADSWTSADNSDHPLWNVPGSMISQTRGQLVEDEVNAAMQYVGNTTFVVGASLQAGNGADCSGLAMQALYAVGLNPLPSSSFRHTQNGYDFESRYLWADQQIEHVSSPQRGDFVFYTINGVVEHMAIYLGNGSVVEGYTPGARVAPLITGAADHSHIVGYERPLS